MMEVGAELRSAVPQAGRLAAQVAEASAETIRRSPGMAVLASFGLGIVAGLVATALIPERRRPRSWMDHPMFDGIRSVPEHLREVPDRVRDWPETAARSFASVLGRR
jgi:hypothetical protein